MILGGDGNNTNQNESSFTIDQKHTALSGNLYNRNPSMRFRQRHPILFAFILAFVFVLVVCLVWISANWSIDLQPSSNEADTVIDKTVAVDFSIPPPSEEGVDSWVVESSLPRYMSVPDLGMARTPVESLGLKDGTNQIDDPHNIWNAAWYNGSVKPGVDGVGIYTCHTFFSPGGLCDGFGDLPLGTEINIERGDGAIFSYEIIENLTMTKEEAIEYMATLFELPDIADVQQGIALVTCAGTYNIYSGVASHRTMVRAILK